MSRASAAELVYRNRAPSAVAYLKLYRGTGWEPGRELDAVAMREALAASLFCASAWDRDRLVGAGRVVSDGVLYACIYDVIVLPAYQGRGVGRELMERLLHRCRQAEIGSIHLFAARDTEPFYRRLGFRRRADDAPGMKYHGG